MSKIILSPEKLQSQACILTLGTFDGVHRGHQELLSELKEFSMRMNIPSLVFSFSEHPRLIFQENNSPFLLNSRVEKMNNLEKSKVDIVYFQEFDKDFASLEPEEFVKQILIDRLNMKAIVVGHDHAFGKNRRGDIRLLYQLSDKYQFKIIQTGVLTDGGVPISSTKIRQLLGDGDLALANEMLGYNYQIHGRVVSDRKIGRELGFPTANIAVDHPLKLIPKSGVYIINVKYNNEIYQGILNIGNRPTFDNLSFQIEAHLFDFSGNLYDQNLEIELLHRIRDEKKFSSSAELVSAIENDREKALRYFGRLC